MAKKKAEEIRELVMEPAPKELKPGDKTSLVKRKLEVQKGNAMSTAEAAAQIDTGAVTHVETEAEIDTERAAAMGMTSLIEGDDTEHITDLTIREIPLLLSLRAQHARYDIPTFKLLADTYERLKLSHKRQSRAEIIEGIRARIPPAPSPLEQLQGKVAGLIR